MRTVSRSCPEIRRCAAPPARAVIGCPLDIRVGACVRACVRARECACACACAGVGVGVGVGGGWSGGGFNVTLDGWCVYARSLSEMHQIKSVTEHLGLKSRRPRHLLAPVSDTWALPKQRGPCACAHCPSKVHRVSHPRAVQYVTTATSTSPSLMPPAMGKPCASNANSRRPMADWTRCSSEAANSAS